MSTKDRTGPMSPQHTSKGIVTAAGALRLRMPELEATPATAGPTLLQANAGRPCRRRPCPCPCRIRLCHSSCLHRPCLCPLARSISLRLCWCIGLRHGLCPCNSRKSRHQASRPFQAAWGRGAADAPCHDSHSTPLAAVALHPCLFICLCQKHQGPHRDKATRAQFKRSTARKSPAKPGRQRRLLHPVARARMPTGQRR